MSAKRTNRSDLDPRTGPRVVRRPRPDPEPIRLPLKDCPSVRVYIASQPESSRPTLRRVRAAIRAAIPEAREGIAWDMPAYRVVDGRTLSFAGWTNHWAIYAGSPELVAAFGAELAPCVVVKSAIRFKLGEPVPVELVARIARYCLRGELPRTVRPARQQIRAIPSAAAANTDEARPARFDAPPTM